MTLATEPTAQPTNMVFSCVTARGLKGTFTAADPAVVGYLVVRNESSTPNLDAFGWNGLYGREQAIGQYGSHRWGKRFDDNIFLKKWDKAHAATGQKNGSYQEVS